MYILTASKFVALSIVRLAAVIWRVGLAALLPIEFAIEAHRAANAAAGYMQNMDQGVVFVSVLRAWSCRFLRLKVVVQQVKRCAGAQIST
jgi:hypothetical protein